MITPVFQKSDHFFSPQGLAGERPTYEMLDDKMLKTCMGRMKCRR
jgi:hypothetical protein